MKSVGGRVACGMSEKPTLIPGPDHPITVEPATARVVVTAAGKTVADTRSALVLREATYPAVYYIPPGDADQSLLEPSDNHTYCPYKGDASYFSLGVAGERGRDAVWSYQQPYEAVAAIKDHLAFYPDRVDAIEELPL
jgi:uncharacterized protein (DUF427 family)